jgi:hypothetical protein
VLSLAAFVTQTRQKRSRRIQYRYSLQLYTTISSQASLLSKHQESTAEKPKIAHKEKKKENTMAASSDSPVANSPKSEQPEAAAPEVDLGQVCNHEK